MDSIEHLLHCCFWSQDSLIQHYIDHPMTLRKETGLTGDPAIPPPAKGAELACPVCLLVVPTSDMLWLWCNHACCKVSVVSPSLYLSSSTAHPHPLTPHTSPPPNHTYTQLCWKSHLVAQVHINKALLCSCPIYGCHARPTRSFFIAVFGEESETVDEVLFFLNFSHSLPCHYIVFSPPYIAVQQGSGAVVCGAEWLADVV